MSTRVDKGGPKFKPILKTKARPSATPAPHDVRTRPSAEPGNSMPPPANIPERTPSVAPIPTLSSSIPEASSSSAAMQLRPSASSPITLKQSSRPFMVNSQPSRPQGSGSPIPVVVTRPSPLPRTHVRPSRATPVTVQPTDGPVAMPGPSRKGSSSLTSSTVIRDPSRGTSALPVVEISRGVPISVSRPLPASSMSIPSASSNGKKRAAPETTEKEGSNRISSVNAGSSEQRGSVAQKRPKLSILQAEEDRVKRRPARRAKSKSTPVDTDIEENDTRQATSDAEGQRQGKRPGRKKKTVDENTEERTAENGSTQEKRKRRRKQTQDAETDDAGEANDSPSASSVPPRKRQRRVTNVEATEPEGTPEPIDPTQIKMSAICDDPGSGRVSSRWESSQTQYADARKRAREERARALAEADEEERTTGRIGAKKAAPKPVLPESVVANAQGGDEESVVENTGQNPDEFTYTEPLKASHYAPQVRIGANGEIVLDMDSLQVDRAADPELGEEPYSHVEESDQSKFTNNSSWSKRRVVRWSKEDTTLFYNALRQFGQNYDLIARVLPGRTYKMCKNKFKAEDKKHPALIDEALRNGVAVDLGALSRLTGKDFTGPTPVIEAKQALNFSEDNAPGPADDTEPSNNDQPRAQEICSSGAGDDGSVPGNVENASSEQNIRRSASPPLPSSLLSSTAATRRSYSPPSPESLLRNTGTGEPSSSAPQEDGAVLPRSIPIATPVRTPIAILPTRPGVQAAIVKVTAAAASEPPPEDGMRSSGTMIRAKGKGKNKAVPEEGVEILGFVE